MPLVFAVLVIILIFVKVNETKKENKRQYEYDIKRYRRTNARLERQLVLSYFGDGTHMPFEEAYNLGIEDLKKRMFVPCIPKVLHCFEPKIANDKMLGDESQKHLQYVKEHGIKASNLFEVYFFKAKDDDEIRKYSYILLFKAACLLEQPPPEYDSYLRCGVDKFDSEEVRMRRDIYNSQIPTPSIPISDEQLYNNWFVPIKYKYDTLEKDLIVLKCKEMISKYMSLVDEYKRLQEQYLLTFNYQHSLNASDIATQINSLASTYNNFVLRNASKWGDSPPPDIEMALQFVDV